MKYILFTVIGLAIVFGICFFVSGLIRRKMKKKLPFILHILISIVSGLLVLTIAAGVYLNIHYSADNEAAAVFANSRNIKVNELDNAFFLLTVKERIRRLSFIPERRSTAKRIYR